MNFKVKYSFVLISSFFALAATYDTSSQQCQYDITSQFNQSIIETLQAINSHRVVEHLQFHKARPEQLKYEAENIDYIERLETFGDRIYFRDVDVKIMDNLEFSLQIRWDFKENRLRIFNAELNICVTGFISDEDPKRPSKMENYFLYRIGFKTFFQYHNVSIFVSQPSREIRLEYDAVSNVHFRLCRPSSEKILEREKVRLKNTINPIAMSLALRYFNHNDKLLDTLKAILSHQPHQRITATHPNYPEDDTRQRYCYIIIPPLEQHPHDIVLGSIDIMDLSNFKSLTIQETIEHSIYTLVIGAPQVRIYVNHEIENGIKIWVQFIFKMSHMAITFDRETERFSVNMKYWLCYFSYPNEPPIRLFYANSKNLALVHIVEQAIANSIMPSMKAWKTNESEPYSEKNTKKSIEEMWMEIEKLRGKPEKVASTTPQPHNNSTAIESYNYQIQFDDVAIKVVSATPHHTSNRTNCEFFKSLNIDRKINAVPTSKSIIAKSGTSVVINFHGNFTSINLFVANSQNPRGNNTCQVQIRNENGIKVILPPADNNESKLKKKLDASLVSTVTKSIIRNVKSVIRVPFDICDQSLQIIDDYFQRFIDTVLDKCSLRRK